MPVKIAVATEDQKTITSHFGRAPYYRVFTLENSGIVAEEVRQKTYHGSEAEHSHGEGHSHDHSRMHADMFAPISDCQVLLVGGMGEPAFEKARSAGLEVILAGGQVEDAVQAYLRGELASDPRRIHRHAH